jgi:hypothetical protein
VRNTVEEPPWGAVSRETRRRRQLHPPPYPQARQAVYVVFHVERESLWISSVDNFWAVQPPTDGDTDTMRVAMDLSKLSRDSAADLD